MLHWLGGKQGHRLGRSQGRPLGRPQGRPGASPGASPLCRTHGGGKVCQQVCPEGCRVRGPACHIEIHDACAGFGSAPYSVGRGGCCRCAVRILRRGFRSALDRERGEGREKNRGRGFDQERRTGSDDRRNRAHDKERDGGYSEGLGKGSDKERNRGSDR